MKDKEARQKIEFVKEELALKPSKGYVQDEIAKIRAEFNEVIAGILEHNGLIREYKPETVDKGKWIIRKRTEADKKKKEKPKDAVPVGNPDPPGHALAALLNQQAVNQQWMWMNAYHRFPW